MAYLMTAFTSRVLISAIESLQRSFRLLADLRNSGPSQAITLSIDNLVLANLHVSQCHGSFMVLCGLEASYSHEQGVCASQ